MGNILIFHQSRVFFSFLLLFASAPADLFAGLGDKIEQAFDGAYVQSEGAMKFSSQTRGYYTFGHTRIRWEPPSEIRPFSATAPNVNVGCNGIDITLGGFSYIDGEELVKKLKKMSGAAASFFFEAALSTLCKDCLTILNKLEDFANAINSINFDSCAAANAIGTHMGRKFGELLNSGKNSNEAADEVKENPSTWRKAMNTVEAFNFDLGINLTDLFVAWLSEDGIKNALLNRQGSVLNLAMATKSVGLDMTQNEQKQLTALMRGVLGDLYGTTVTNKTKEGDFLKDVFIWIKSTEGASESFINAMLYGTANCAVSSGTVDMEKCAYGIYLEPEMKYDSAEERAPHFTVSKKALTNLLPKGFVTIAKDRLDQIIAKTGNGEALNESDQIFLGNLPYPIVKAINLKKATFLDDNDMDKIIQYVSIKMARHSIIELLSNISTQVSEITTLWEIGQHAENVDIDRREVLNDFKSRLATSSTALQNTIAKIETEKLNQLQDVIQKFKLQEEVEKALRKQFYVGNNYGGGFGY
jgi:conjugative transfer pilus assembly protein TraH